MLVLKKLHFCSYLEPQSVHFWKKSIHIDPQSVYICPALHRLQLTWTVVDDACSGLREAVASVLLEPAGTVLFSWSERSELPTASMNASQMAVIASVPASIAAQLQQGERHVVRLQVTSHAGFTSEMRSAPFTVDHTPPEIGSVGVGSTGAASTSCLTKGVLQPLSVQFAGFADDTSGISTVELGYGSAQGRDDLTNLTLVATRGEGEVYLTPLESEALSDMPVGTMVYPLLRVTNNVGLSVNASSADGFMISSPSLQPAVCSWT